jgi:hypothetical protein
MRESLPTRRAADTITVRWWPVHDEIPEGWKLSEVARPVHHNRWSKLIERIERKRKKPKR